MRNQWRHLLLRSVCSSRSSFQNPTINLQVLKVNQNVSHLSSFLVRNVHGNAFYTGFRYPMVRSFSSDSAVEQNKKPDYLVLTDILSKVSSNDEIKTSLESNNLSISHKMVIKTLDKLEGNPVIAWKLFNFIAETENDKLSSISYNLMLGILARKDYVKHFWDLVEIMKKKDYRLRKKVFAKILDKGEIVNDLDKLKEMCGSTFDENSIHWLLPSVCKLIRLNEWDEDIQKRLTDMSCSWSIDLVAMTIEHLKDYPVKAFMFFQYVEENASFKHNKLSYNAMLKVLGCDEHADKFWRVANEMKKAGFEMDMEVYDLVMRRFRNRKMVKDIVALYEFVIDSENKPPVQDSASLLPKIVANKDLDMDLFSRVLKIFTEGGNSLTFPIFYSVVRALVSVGRSQECVKILKAMEKGGFVPTKETYDEVIFRLGSVGRSDEAIQMIEDMEASGCAPDFKTSCSLVHGQCVACDLTRASSSFLTMVEKFGVANAGHTFKVLINRFCGKNKEVDAYKFLLEMVDGRKLRPLHTTYKSLIEKLLARGSFNEALGLLSLMKGHDYSPHLDPFFDWISKSGSGADALQFLEAVTDKNTPSTSAFIRMFDAFFKAGRHNEAQYCFSECPSNIRSHADVLKLFHELKPEDAGISAMTA